MGEQTGKLYDRADIYDLIESESRTEFIREDWKRFLGDKDIHTLLDVSIGTGSMTLPLQELGIEVTGSDLSESMIKKCVAKAEEKGKPIELKCSDFRDLSCFEGRTFDCVVSTGNSLGYVDGEGVKKALAAMDSLVSAGGYICFDSRNWEQITRDSQRFYFYNPFFHDGNRVNLMQVWDHHDDGSITFNLLYSFERDNKIFQREIFEEHYHPFPLSLATDKLKELGYEEIDIQSFPCGIPEKDFSKIEWYRVIARKLR